MKKSLYILLFSISFILLKINNSYAWGVWGHKHINKSAVFALPDTMLTFYFNHIDFITEESVVPDIRKYTIGDKNEAAKHYWDLESYLPSDSVPQTMQEAKVKYEDSYMQKNGILPWYLPILMDKLTKAFIAKNKTEILFVSADIGHYIGDAHMPLHTSVNYDGQETNQKGIHSFWESQLPEMFGKKFNLHTNAAKYIPDVQAEMWDIIYHTHSLADSLLVIEKELNDTFAGEKYMLNDSNQIKTNSYKQKFHSYAYAKAYNQNMHGMVEAQMKLSIQDLANFWYTAWVNAGSPNLVVLDDEELTTQNKIFLEKEKLEWQSGKVIHLKMQKEYE